MTYQHDRSEIATIARKLMNQHGLGGWIFAWDNCKTSFGMCRYSKRTITLSSTLLNFTPRHEVIDTILHEIAHALTPGAKHGYVWQQKARQIGASPNRCKETNMTATEKESIANYAHVCPRCDKHSFFNRLTRKRQISRFFCTICFRKTGEKFYVHTKKLS